MKEYTDGLAMIVEGATEKVFYSAFLEHLQSKKANARFQKMPEEDGGDILYEWEDENRCCLIKINVVGTVSQLVNSGKWFENRCAKKYKIPWTVFLCYDTDSSDADVSKFHEGDWDFFRKELKKSRARDIIDLAASADIEDIMLCDLEGVCRKLGMEKPDNLKGRKGKAKMKALFRSRGTAYHEGEKAEPLIKSLDMDKIAETAPIGLNRLEDYILGQTEERN